MIPARMIVGWRRNDNELVALVIVCGVVQIRDAGVEVRASDVRGPISWSKRVHGFQVAKAGAVAVLIEPRAARRPTAEVATRN
jgi:hypothetical protein